MTKPVARGTFRRTCKCGWSGTYSTRGRAKAGRARHSCVRWRAKVAAAQRDATRRDAVDRSPQPCLHAFATHEHGTRACYTLDKCRCGPCASAAYDYEQNRVRQHAYARWDNLVDAAPVRRHVLALMADGIGGKRVARSAGVSVGAITKLLYGTQRPDGTRTPTRRMQRDVAAKLLDVQVLRAPGAHIRPGEMGGLRLRLQALVALGWSQARLADHLGTTPSHFSKIVAGGQAVRVERAAAIRALYDQLSMTLPPADTPAAAGSVSRAKAYAAARQWLPPLGLDDDLLDQPDYDPATGLVQDTDHDDQHHHDHDDDADVVSLRYDEAAVVRRLSGDRDGVLTRADRVEIVRRARALGWTNRDLAEVAGVSRPDRYTRTSADRPRRSA